MAFEVVVSVSLRPGIADPEGATIERALGALGYGNSHDVKVGKTISFVVESADHDEVEKQVDEMCKKLLTNPVIEDSSILVRPVDGAA